MGGGGGEGRGVGARSLQLIRGRGVRVASDVSLMCELNYRHMNTHSNVAPLLCSSGMRPDNCWEKWSGFCCVVRWYFRLCLG